MKTTQRALWGVLASLALAACNTSEESCESGWQTESSSECLPWTECSSSQYEAEAPSAGADRICSALTQCVAGEFESEAATATSDRVCAPITECEPGSFESEAATATSDRVCAPITECEPGSFESEAPTATSDRVCSECPEGNFCEGGVAQPQPFTSCNQGEYIAAPGSSVDDSTCFAITQCDPDNQSERFQALITDGTGTMDQECCATVGNYRNSIRIGNSWPIRSLGTENCLVSRGYLIFEPSPSAPPLAWVGADHIRIDQTNLTDLSILTDLEFINGTVDVNVNPGLVTFDGWPSRVTSIGGSLVVNKNNALIDINALSSIQEIGTLEKAGLRLSDLPSLTSLPDFSDLATISSGLWISNVGISELPGFNSLGNLEYLYVFKTPSLETVSGFNALTTIGIEGSQESEFTIQSNAVLRRITGFLALTQVHGLPSIQQNFRLCPTDVDAIVNRASIVDVRYIGANHGRCL